MDAEIEARVVVQFHSSSTKGGQEAYKVSVTDQATQEDVNRAVELAIGARNKCLAVLTPAEVLV